MTKPVSEMNKRELKEHQKRLAIRRQRQQAKRAERRMAARASEDSGDETTEVDFEKLVRAEAKLQSDQKALEAMAGQGGKQAPKPIRVARENLSEAFEFMGGVPALVVWGRKNRTEFYRIWARLVPKEAAPEDERMPLEQLLEQLAAKSDTPVAQAALEIGAMALEEGRRGAAEEDAEAVRVKKRQPGRKYEIN